MRLPDWQQRFWARIEEARTTPFQWGVHDCVMFATSCADAITGGNLTADALTRFPYSSEEEAAALMADNGGLAGLAQPFWGDAVNWGQLGIGDIILVDPIPRVTATEMLCVHDGAQLIGASNVGISRAPFACARYGWKIG